MMALTRIPCKFATFLHIVFWFLWMTGDVTAQQNSTQFTLKGCYYDDSEYDVLPDLITCSDGIHQSCINVCEPDRPYCQSEELTVELCFQICANQNARYFGLQDGRQCLCGGAYARYNARGSPTTSPDPCGNPCSGNASQICGGSFEMLIYEITDATSDCFHPGYVTLGGDSYPPPSGPSDFSINDTLDYNAICRDPSTLSNTDAITCIESGWSSTPPTCTVRCSTPEAIPFTTFAQTAQSSFGVGETVSYTCTANATSYSAECAASGFWVFPVDCPVTCPGSALPEGGSLDPMTETLENYVEGTSVAFVCASDGTRFTLTCGGAGEWDPPSVICPDVTTLTTSPIDGELTTMMAGSTTGETDEGSGGASPVWVIPVTIILVLLLIVLIVILIFICYRKRTRRQDRDVPQVVLGYIKRTGTFGATLKRNRDMEADLSAHPEVDGDPAAAAAAATKKGNTLTHSLSTMKQQIAKRVTLGRSRPELPPKKNPKRSRTGDIYDSPHSVRANSGGANCSPSPLRKMPSQISMVPSFHNGLDDDDDDDTQNDRLRDVAFDKEDGGDGVALKGGRGSELLDDLMVEFDGRINHGFDDESLTRSSPSLASMSTANDSPARERAVIHTAVKRPQPPTPDNAKRPQPKSPVPLPKQAQVSGDLNASVGNEQHVTKPSHEAGGNHGDSVLTVSASLPTAVAKVDDAPNGHDVSSDQDSNAYADVGGNPTAEQTTKSEVDADIMTNGASDYHEIGRSSPANSVQNTSQGINGQARAPDETDTNTKEMNGHIGSGPPSPLHENPKTAERSHNSRPPPLSIDVNGSAGLINGHQHRSRPAGQESPQYATLGEAVPAKIVSPPPTPLKHEYVNVGRSSTPTSMSLAKQQFFHPRPPSPPPDEL